ncbi:MAG: hypothetical protein OSB57_01840 [Planctomycetota bacterium]|jgi:hypothetical protein|nr:hypothetical protein [Planctomycetota bacterium]
MSDQPEKPQDTGDRNPDGTFAKGNNVAGGGWNAHTFSLRQMIARTLHRDPNLAQLVVDNLIESASVKDAASLGFIRELLKQTDGAPAAAVEVQHDTSEEIILEHRNADDESETQNE